MPSKELIAASSRPLILSILAERESYGYAMLQRIREQSGGKLQWSEGMLYPVLHRLEREGLIKSTWQLSENGRKRKYYKVVRKGMAALAEERRQWMTVHESLAAFWRVQAQPT